MLKDEISDAINKTAKEQSDKWNTLGHITSVVVLSGLTAVITKGLKDWMFYSLILVIVSFLTAIAFKNDIKNWNLVRKVTKKKYQNREKIRKYLQEVLYAKERERLTERN